MRREYMLKFSGRLFWRKKRKSERNTLILCIQISTRKWCSLWVKTCFSYTVFLTLLYINPFGSSITVLHLRP